MSSYDETPGINWSLLSAMNRSPLHYRHRSEQPRRDTDAMRIGRCAHMAILEPDRLVESVATWTGKIRRGKEWDDFKDENGDREILSLHERDLVAGMAAAVLCNPDVEPLLTGPRQVEQTATWTDAPTGLACKGRLDVLRGDGQLVDLKTSRAVEPWSFAQSAARYLYHGQIAYYYDGAGCTGDPMIISVESTPPHDVVVYNCAALLEPGRALYRRLLDKLKVCMDSDTWPGVASGVVPLELPAWAQETDGADGLEWDDE